MPATHSKTTDIAPPTYLSASQKKTFLKLIKARFDGGKPVSAGEIDMVSDLILARSRIGDLIAAYRRALRKSRENGYDSFSQRGVLAIGRQIDSATARAHRMEQRLGM